jgi:hypothetical protein
MEGSVYELPCTNHYAINKLLRKMVGLSRFELLTPRLSSVCSNQLSYRPSSDSSAQSSSTLHELSKNRYRSDSLKTR